MPVIRIIAAAPVVYSLDGRSKARFAPGELYQVPDHAARGMIRRGWAHDAHEEPEMVQQSGTAPEHHDEGESARARRSGGADIEERVSDASGGGGAPADDEGDAAAFEHTESEGSFEQGAVPRHRRKSWKGS